LLIKLLFRKMIIGITLYAGCLKEKKQAANKFKKPVFMP